MNAQEFGRLQAEVAAQRRDLDRMATSMETMAQALEAVQHQLAEAKGGWKTLVLVGGASATMSAVIVKLAVWWAQSGPK